MIQKLICVIVVLCLFQSGLKAQGVTSYEDKLPIDTSVLGKWQTMGAPTISADGNYVIYDYPDKIPQTTRILAVQSTGNSWKKEFRGGSKGAFSPDSKWAVVRAGDSICILRTGKEGQSYLSKVRQFNLVERGRESWLVYETNDKQLVLRDLTTGKEEQEGEVEQYWLSPGQDRLLWEGNDHSLKEMELKGGKRRQVCEAQNKPLKDVLFNWEGTSLVYSSDNGLHHYDLTSNKDELVSEGATNRISLQMDNKGEQMAWIADNAIWYWREGMSGAEKKLTNGSPGIDRGMEIGFSYGVSFSQDGERLLFKLVKKPEAKITKPKGMPEIWNYQDPQLLPAMENDMKKPKHFAAVCSVNENRVIRIEQAGESSGTGRTLFGARKYVLLIRLARPEWWWRKQEEAHIDLVSLVNGSRPFHQVFPFNGVPILFYELSPDERFLVYYDPKKEDYMSYEVASGHTSNLTKGMAVSWEAPLWAASDQAPYPDPLLTFMHNPIGIAGWLQGGARVLLRGRYDLWSVDPSGKEAPVNLTGGYGRQHKTRFSMVAQTSGSAFFPGFSSKQARDTLILETFNLENKQAGLCRVPVDNPGRLQWLFQGDFSMYPSFYKATSADTWVLQLCSPTDAPNLYVSKHWQPLRKLTDVQPQKEYRWYTSELVSWQLSDGDTCQGILYKPDQMEPGKKYPVLFDYYEGRSFQLFDYLAPKWLEDCNVNVPYFVSQGYLVFEPDIHIHIGDPGPSALACVESAAQLLAKRSYVDGTKMALLGHSYGGYETNYILTHSNLFAAAAEGAGMSDFVSDYGSIEGVGTSSQVDYEVGQCRVGTTLWERPDLYIENSAVFKANKVTTPLLMLHNKLDNAVPWLQGVELFTALRRLGKPCWMLEYPGEGHGIRGKHEEDYTIRLTQFFDHYLKDTPLPEWMEESKNGNWQSRYDGYSLDQNAPEPPNKEVWYKGKWQVVGADGSNK